MMRFSLLKHLCVLAIWVALGEGKGRDMCTAGTFFKNGKCLSCPKGTYQDKPGSLACEPCPAGTFFRFTGGQALDVCQPCPAGTFNDKTRSTSMSACKKCPKRKDSVEGSPFCLSCPPGQVISWCFDVSQLAKFVLTRRRCQFDDGSEGPIALKCRNCTEDTFSDRPNARKCQQCKLNEFSQSGATKCSPCTSTGCEQKCEDFYVFDIRERFFDPVFDQFIGGCTSCPPGLVGNKRVGATKCIPCPPGTFSNEDTQGCKPCDLGENTKVSGASVCKPDDTPCPDNFFRDAGGACKRCNRMQKFNPKKKRCDPCRPGEESDGGLAIKCSKCTAGSFSSEEGCNCKPGRRPEVNGKCVKCPPGQISQNGLFCISCGGGEISPRAGASECIQCPAYPVDKDFEQSKCSPCPKGTVPRIDGLCVVPETNCPPNTKRLLDKKGTLYGCSREICPAGRFKETQRGFGEFKGGFTFCSFCGSFQRYVPKARKCKSCNGDEVSNGGLDTKCRKCPKGMTRHNDGCACVSREMVGGVCRRCPRGSVGFDEMPGCVKCPAGTLEISRICENCPAGSFSNAGSTRCKKCPKGTTTFGLGDANCVKPGTLK